MKKFLCLLNLLLLLSSCSRTTPPPHSPLEALDHLKITVPDHITADTFDIHFGVYEVLPLSHKLRPALRQVLMRSLKQEIEKKLKFGDSTEAFRLYKKILKLYDPQEIYRGEIRNKEVDRLSKKFVHLFSPRGEETKVILPLCVSMTLRPHEMSNLKTSFQQITKWIEEADYLAHGPSRKYFRLVSAMEKTVKYWPSPFVIEELRKLYIAQKLNIARSVHIAPYRHLSGAVSSLFRTGFKIVRLYLYVDHPKEALRRLEEFGIETASDEKLRLLLEQTVSPSTNVSDWLQLSDFFEDADKSVSLRICRVANRRFPEHNSVHFCIGRLASVLKKTYLAILHLERALKLAPQNWSYAQLLAQQYQMRLSHLVGDEKLDEAHKELERIEAFYQDVEKRFSKALHPRLSRVYYAMGHGLYNAGAIDKAVEIFKKAYRAHKEPESLLQLALIELKRSNLKKCAQYLFETEELHLDSAHARAYWQGKVENIRAQLLELEGKVNQSKDAHARAIEAWQQLQAMELLPDDQAEAAINEARDLFALNQPAKAMDALDRAVDLQPNRKETYADTIALLTTYGHLPEALDAFHRALGRKEVTEYLKSYCSFWIIGLARRAGLLPDPLAVRHLKHLKNRTWYYHIGKLVLGEASFVDLQKIAKTKGELAELNFYWADRLLSEGKVSEARQLWTKVLESDMMAFNEFEMATFYLRHGPKSVATQPVDRLKVSAKQSK